MSRADRLRSGATGMTMEQVREAEDRRRNPAAHVSVEEGAWRAAQAKEAWKALGMEDRRRREREGQGD